MKQKVLLENIVGQFDELNSGCGFSNLSGAKSGISIDFKSIII